MKRGRLAMAVWEKKGKEKQRRDNRGDRMKSTNPLAWGLADAKQRGGNNGCTQEQRNQN
jgi:hypothetical protein